MAFRAFLKERLHPLYSIAAHRIQQEEGGCGLQCGLGPGMEKASVDFDNLHISAGSEFFLPEIGKSPFY